MLSRSLSVLPFVLMAAACGASHEAVPPESDAGVLDPWPPRCASAEVVARWVSGWRSESRRGVVTVEGDAFYVLQRGFYGDEVGRLDPSGTWSAPASTSTTPAWPFVQLMIWDDELALARWGDAELEMHAVFEARASATVPIGPRVYAVAALDAERLVAVSDSPDQPPSIEIVSVDGTVLRDREPLVDGWASVIEGPTGAAVMVHGADGRIHAWDETTGVRALEERGCPMPHLCAADLLPLGEGAFAWARSTETDAFVEVHSSGAAPVRVALPAEPLIDTLALGRGPDDTIVLVISRQGVIELLVFDATTLAELATGTLASDAVPLDGTEFAPPLREIVEISRTTIDGVFALRAIGEIPDGQVERWALGIACAP